MNGITEYHMTASNRPYLIEKIKSLDPTIIWTVTAKPRRSKRSNEQNRWMRGFATDFGAYLGYSPDEMYSMLMYKFCPEFITLPDGKELRIPGHFSTKQDGTKRTTKEAAEIQDYVQQWASELGFIWQEN